MMNSAEQEKLKADLKQCKTVADIFDHLFSAYDLDSCTLSPITKPLFISGVIKGIIMVNPKKK